MFLSYSLMYVSSDHVLGMCRSQIVKHAVVMMPVVIISFLVNVIVSCESTCMCNIFQLVIPVITLTNDFSLAGWTSYKRILESQFLSTKGTYYGYSVWKLPTFYIFERHLLVCFFVREIVSHLDNFILNTFCWKYIIIILGCRTCHSTIY